MQHNLSRLQSNVSRVDVFAATLAAPTVVARIGSVKADSVFARPDKRLAVTFAVLRVHVVMASVSNRHLMTAAAMGPPVRVPMSVPQMVAGATRVNLKSDRFAEECGLPSICDLSRVG
jgi:hypothetical protein